MLFAKDNGNLTMVLLNPIEARLNDHRLYAVNQRFDDT